MQARVARDQLVLLGQRQNFGVEFDVVYARERGVLQCFRGAAASAATNEKQGPRRSVLEECVVDGFLGGLDAGHGEDGQAVLVEGPAALAARQHEIPVDGVAYVDDVERVASRPGRENAVSRRGARAGMQTAAARTASAMLRRRNSSQAAAARFRTAMRSAISTASKWRMRTRPATRPPAPEPAASSK